MLIKTLAAVALLATAATAQAPKGKAFDHVFIIYLENTQVELALKMATKRSLIVLDEFGKGTTSTEHFAKRTQDRPRVLATTHFHELFENQLLDLSLPISLYTMEVLQQANCVEATFLFRVISGKAPSSLGPVCASMAGMPSSVVQRGIVLSDLFRRYEKVIPVLTERELVLQRMYEHLTSMLLQLDIDADFNLYADDDEELDTAQDVSDSKAAISRGNIATTAIGSLEINGDMDDSDVSSSACHSTAPAKRKRREREGDMHGQSSVKAISELMKYAAQIYEMEQAPDD
ncbi:MutS protein msh5 [Mortierella claussenii]|nr:MutS protein msh5 [Mortierella claussenii]